MNFREKKKHYNELQGEQYFDADLQLLQKNNPKCKLLRRNFSKNARAQKEILWGLLDSAVRDEIVANRRTVAKAADFEVNLAAAVDICKQIIAIETKAEAVVLEKELKKITEKLPEKEAAEALEIASQRIEQLQETEDASLRTRTANLLVKMDLSEKIDYQLLKKLVKDLGLETPNLKTKVLLKALVDFKSLYVNGSAEVKVEPIEVQGSTENKSDNSALGTQVFGSDLSSEIDTEKKNPKPGEKAVQLNKKKKSTQTSTGKALTKK